MGLRTFFIGHYNAAREVGSADDIWVLQGQVRYQKASVMVGARSPFQDVPLFEGGEAKHFRFGAQYQITPENFVGAEYARYLDSHEVRVLVGIW